MATMTGSRWSVRWSSAAPALHSSPSELSFRVGVVLSLARVAEFGAGLLVFHIASTIWVGSTFVFGEVGVACSEIREGDDACWGEVMAMTSVCDVDETLYVRCVWYYVCAAQRFVTVFARFSVY